VTQRARRAQVMLVVRPHRQRSGTSRMRFAWYHFCRSINTRCCYSTSIPSQHQQQGTHLANTSTTTTKHCSIEPTESRGYQAQQSLQPQHHHNALRNTSPRHAPHLGPPNDGAAPLRSQPHHRQALPSAIRRHVSQAWADSYIVSSLLVYAPCSQLCTDMVTASSLSMPWFSAGRLLLSGCTTGAYDFAAQTGKGLDRMRRDALSVGLGIWMQGRLRS
jgi:hypothetical protein